MGNKIEAKRIARKAGVDLIPGSPDKVTAEDPDFLKNARRIGYPLIVKASAGGGGKGMRIVTHEENPTHLHATTEPGPLGVAPHKSPV